METAIRVVFKTYAEKMVQEVIERLKEPMLTYHPPELEQDLPAKMIQSMRLLAQEEGEEEGEEEEEGGLQDI